MTISYCNTVLSVINTLCSTDPCDQIRCARGVCHVADHQPICTCLEGYHQQAGVCEDIDECQQNPCHPSARCQNTAGSFVCSCPDGLVGDPFQGGCRYPDECSTHSDCPLTAACEQNRCTNPCARAAEICGQNAECSVNAHEVRCTCPPNTRGDPHTLCKLVECTDNNDCAVNLACVDTSCVDPCTLEHSCGRNADCTVENHVGICTCHAETTGNPLLGCVPIQYCSNNQQCQSGTICNAGVCCSLCTTNRDCVGDQVCLQGICQPTCQTNATCAEFQFCQNSICVQQVRCRADDECGPAERCEQDAYGRAECRNACESGVLCGRNAECTARDHQAVCSCRAGFAGDATAAGGVGCKPIECEQDEQCSADKLCDGNVCRLACLLGESCGANALCAAENHRKVCHCQPGFTGDARQHCEPIDACREAPCGPGARCTTANGVFQCGCEHGLVGDAYNEGCRPAVECVHDADCPANAACITVLGEPKCKDVCEDAVCGRNAQCVAENHVGLCGCRSGFDGNPLDRTIGCRLRDAVCAVNDDCPANAYCHAGVCKSEWGHWLSRSGEIRNQQYFYLFSDLHAGL